MAEHCRAWGPLTTESGETSPASDDEEVAFFLASELVSICAAAGIGCRTRCVLAEAFDRRRSLTLWLAKTAPLLCSYAVADPQDRSRPLASSESCVDLGRRGQHGGEVQAKCQPMVRSPSLTCGMN